MNLCIVQARMGSTRLPGKVLKSIGNKTLLEHLMERIALSTKVDKIIIATTTSETDDALAEFCTQHSWNVFRGSENDVLDRFYQTIISNQLTPDAIVRVTADCPLHHGEVVDFALNEFSRRHVDYFSNSNAEPVLEDGCDTEVFTFKSLETAWREAQKPSEREHVTPYIKNSSKFVCAWAKSHPRYHYKLSVDNHADFEMVSEIYKNFAPDDLFTIERVVKFLETHPEVLEINKHSVINAGYTKSLNEDSPQP